MCVVQYFRDVSCQRLRELSRTHSRKGERELIAPPGTLGRSEYRKYDVGLTLTFACEHLKSNPRHFVGLVAGQPRKLFLNIEPIARWKAVKDPANVLNKGLTGVFVITMRSREFTKKIKAHGYLTRLTKLRVTVPW